MMTKKDLGKGKIGKKIGKGGLGNSMMEAWRDNFLGVSCHLLHWKKRSVGKLMRKAFLWEWILH